MEELGCFGVKPLFQGHFLFAKKRGAYMDVFTTESIYGVFTENDPIPYPEFRLIIQILVSG